VTSWIRETQGNIVRFWLQVRTEYERNLSILKLASVAESRRSRTSVHRLGCPGSWTRTLGYIPHHGSNDRCRALAIGPRTCDDWV